MRASFFADDVAAARTGARNMAVDHALLEHAQREHRPALRLYRWQPACLSFGRNQEARGRYDPETAARLGLDLVRRPTGGLAVLHDTELTYSFSAPAKLLGGPRGTYVAINRVLVAALRQVGVRAELSQNTARVRFGAIEPCFAEAAAGEVVVEGRKLVGSAQRCERNTILQHGSLLLEDAQADISRVAVQPVEMNGHATSVSAVLGKAPDIDEIVRAIAANFEDVCGICLAPARLNARIEARADQLESFYASTEWTWRR